jgi:hypothetical protein
MLKRARTVIVIAVIPMRLCQAFGVTAVVMCAAAPVPATASTIVLSNLANSSPFFSAGVGWSLSDETSALSVDYDLGVSFTPSADYTLDSVTVAFWSTEGTNAFDLSLRSDSFGPGATIETLLLPTYSVPPGRCSPPRRS